MPIIAQQATSSADPSAAVGNASDAREDRLPLHVPIRVSAVLALVTSEHQISLLGFQTKPTKIASKRTNFDQSNIFFYQLLGLDPLNVVVHRHSLILLFSFSSSKTSAMLG